MLILSRIRAMKPTRLLATIVTLAAGAAACDAQGAQPVPSADAAALRADLAQFRSEFLGVERSYTAEARARAGSRVAALERALDTISPGAFELEIARIVALADNGHSNVFTGTRTARFNRVPVRFVPLAEGFVVLRARAPHADLLGARLVAIERKGVGEIVALARTLTGGTDEWRDGFAPFFMESPQQMRALGAIADANAATYRFALPDGRTVERRLVAEPPDESRSRHAPRRWLFAEPAEGEGEGMQALERRAPAPWALQELGTPFRWRHDAELDAVIVELRQNSSPEGRPIQSFLATVEAEIARLRPRHLVLDMRLNGGGNLQTTRDFAKRIPTLVPGHIFALTSRWTFSAAISTVGYLKQEAPDRVRIVGEMVGDRLDFFAEGGPVTLRNTGIMIGRSLQRHDYANGCRSYTDCHGPVVRYPIAVKSLAPDIAAPWSAAALREGRDPAMEAVRAALR